MGRRHTIVVAPVAAMLLPSPAHAGGWDRLTFPKEYYLVGAVASASDEFFVGTADDAFGDLDIHVFHAYLLPLSETESGFGMIQPPRVPRAAIDLGIPEVTGPIERDGALLGRISLTFTVPHVRTGTYAIGFCDVPCVRGTIGYLAAGRIRIVHTKMEGELMSTLDRRDMDIYRLRGAVRRAERDTRSLEEALEVRSEALRLERLDATTPSERVVAVVVAADGLDGRTWIGLTAAIAVAVVIGFSVGRTRGRRRPVIPDTIPASWDVSHSEPWNTPD